MLTALDALQSGLLPCALAGLGGREASGLSAAEGEAQAQEAMTWLRQAADADYGDYRSWQADADLDPLRTRPDFQLLMMDVAMPHEPFAGAR